MNKKLPYGWDKLPTKQFKSPLGTLVMSAFAESACHDRITIATFLGAPTFPPRGLKAYITVAEDVLEVLRLEGLLFRDEAGWYRSSIRQQLE